MITKNKYFFPLDESLAYVAEKSLDVNDREKMSKLEIKDTPLALALTGYLDTQEKEYEFYHLKYTLAINTYAALSLECIDTEFIPNLAQYSYDMLRKYTENKFYCITKYRHSKENGTPFNFRIPNQE